MKYQYKSELETPPRRSVSTFLIGDHRISFVPGINEMSDEDWTIAQSDAAVQELIENKILVVEESVNAKPAEPTPKQSAAKAKEL